MILKGLHNGDSCYGQACCIHNPSVHPLKDAPFNWRADKGLMERICGHGIGHPDPDHMAFAKTVLEDDEWAALGVHGCDECCSWVQP